MDYKEKYEQAFERARQFSEHPLMEDSSNVVEYVFPELCQSEDEKIRKMLIEFFGKGAENNSSTNGISDKDILSWLEKQKHKPTWSEEDDIGLDDALWCCKQAASIAKDENDMGNAWYAEKWLKSLKERIGG